MKTLSDELEDAAEELLRQEAQRRGVGLRDLGILSGPRRAVVARHEIPWSLMSTQGRTRVELQRLGIGGDDEEEDDA